MITLKKEKIADHLGRFDLYKLFRSSIFFTYVSSLVGPSLLHPSRNIKRKCSAFSIPCGLYVDCIFEQLKELGKRNLCDHFYFVFLIPSK